MCENACMHVYQERMNVHVCIYVCMCAYMYLLVYVVHTCACVWVSDVNLLSPSQPVTTGSFGNTVSEF